MLNQVPTRTSINSRNISIFPGQFQAGLRADEQIYPESTPSHSKNSGFMCNAPTSLLILQEQDTWNEATISAKTNENKSY